MAAQFEENPVETLERLHLKLIVADSDAQIQKFTTNHLVHVIQLAASNPNAVNMVTEMLQYYNRRIKNSETVIAFPIKELLQLIGEGTFQTNLSNVYLKIALGKYTPQERIDLLPDFFAIFAEKINDLSVCNDIFLLALPALIAIAKLPNEKWPKLDLSQPVINRLSRYFLLLLLFENDKTTMAHLHRSLAQATSIFPGLSQEDCEYMENKVLHHFPTLTEAKESIIRLLDYDFLQPQEAFPLLVVGSASQLNSIAEASNMALKKVDTQDCIDNPKVVEKLMDIYLGTAGKAERNKNLSERLKIPHCSHLIKTKILPFLTRSRIAPKTFMANVRVCLDLENGIQNHKKTLSLLQFILVVVENMPESGLNAFSTNFFNKILKVIENGDIETSQCAALAYRCLGLLGKAKPALVLERMDIIEKLFDCIAGNAEDVAAAVTECLTAWHYAFIRVEDSTILEKLKDIIKTHIVNDNNRTRLTAVKYADALLRSGDMEIRWLLICIAGDKRDDIRKEGLRLLETSFRMPAPPIPTSVDYIWRGCNRKVSEVETDFFKITPEVLEMCAKFIWVSCGVRSGDQSKMLFLEDDEHFYQISPQVVALLKTFPQETIEKVTRIALMAATCSQDLFLLRIATCFVLVHPIEDMPTCSTACVQVARGSSRFEVLEAASRLSVLTATHAENTKRLEKYLSDLDTNPLPGTPWLTVSTITYGEFEEAEKTTVYERLYKRLLTVIASAYDHPSSLLESSCGALCVLLKNGFKIYEMDQKLAFDLIEICEKVVTSRKEAVTLRARHAAVDAIGLFNSEAEGGLILEKIQKTLYAVGEGPPQTALQLAVGQALWNSSLGSYASIRRELYLEAEVSNHLMRLLPEQESFCIKNLNSVYKDILGDKLSSRNHHLRRAAVVWLVIFVQRCIVLANEMLNRKLPSIQMAFANGLTEDDDFTQDMASKGMGLLYQNASYEHRKLLVTDLMNMLGSGRSNTVKVSDDTEIFKENALGKAPDGSNLSTYKELCNLATDLNQPDLLYKFMQLAKHNATWNSKKGAAFGFGEILERAKEDLEPHLGRLVPKLFRYRYDPDIKVQQSMRSIWSVLTSGRKNIIEKYADEIAKEILPLLTDKEWRVRESSCLALADLLHSNDTPYMHAKLPDSLFETIMRVRDDIKESVRVAADRAADSMRKLIIRLGSSTNREKSEKFLKEMMPVVIEKGVNSTVKSTVEYSLAMLMEMSKTAGKQLQPFLDTLIPCFLDAISENESAVLNYLAVRSSANQLEALDDLRTQYAGQSPMMVACNELLPYIDSNVLKLMDKKMVERLKSCGMSTRAATAQLITQLCLRAPQLMIDNRPVCEKFFYALGKGIGDGNPSVRKNSANALSYIAKFCSPVPIEKLMNKLKTYLLSDCEDKKRAAHHVLKNFSSHCPDVLQGHSVMVLPYVFLETCREVIKGDDLSKKRQEEWSEIWEEMVPGSTSSTLSLYKKEMIEVAVDVLLNNSVWMMKAQAGRMIARVADTLGEGLSGSDSEEILTKLLPVLPGRTWEGKEKILLAVAAIISASGKQLVEIRGERMNEISEILQQEAEKKNKNYATVALSACATYAEHIPSTEMAQWIQQRVAIVVEKIRKGENSGSDDEEMSNLEKEALNAKFVASNLVAFTHSLTAYRNGADAELGVTQLAGLINDTGLYWKTRQDVLVELQAVVDRWQLATPLKADLLVQSLLKVAEEMCDYQRKTIAAQALQIVLRMAERRDSFTMNWSEITAALKTARAAKETGMTNRIVTALEVEEDCEMRVED